MPSQFAQKAFGTDSPSQAIEKWFEIAADQYFTFFDANTIYTAPNVMVNDCVGMILPLVPIFFTSCQEVMPQKRIAELLVFSNVSLPFTEHELCMHIVSNN